MVQVEAWWILLSFCISASSRAHYAYAAKEGSYDSKRRQHGRFLHITDFHPDPFYKVGSSVDKSSACHRNSGRAGCLGAEMTNCDSPISLINATFTWIEKNIKDEIDFIVWTGDSARHDNDEHIIRSEDQVIDQNKFLVQKFYEVFRKPDNLNDPDPNNDFMIPIIPTIGNNDILPHNIFLPGPNKWTMTFYDIWRQFIPEFQRHQFEHGGWFFVEVIPNKLAVFSLNTMYFYDRNGAVDGCARESEPGYDHMDWLRVQLGFMRKRGLKVILIGHVPPARTDSKSNWDETCWQKYVLWLRQYRDIIVGAFYGHMNIDHFMLQDFEEVSITDLKHTPEVVRANGVLEKDSVSLQSAKKYLIDLRNDWSRLPNEPSKEYMECYDLGKDTGVAGHKRKGKKHKSKNKRYLHEIGGKWAERFAVSQIGPSVIPNYFPTLRVFSYNISGFDDKYASQNRQSLLLGQQQVLAQNQPVRDDKIFDTNGKSSGEGYWSLYNDGVEAEDYPKKNKKKKPSPTIPDPPPLGSSPGPAYSPQAFSLLGYTQYFANLSAINKSMSRMPEGQLDMKDNKLQTYGDMNDSVTTGGNHPNQECEHMESLRFEIEYDTRDDKVFNLKDLTVRNYLRLAERIGKVGLGSSYDDKDMDLSLDRDCTEYDELSDDNALNEMDMKMEESSGLYREKKKKKKKKKKNKGGKYLKNDAWLTFVKRAFVGTKDDDEIKQKYG